MQVLVIPWMIYSGVDLFPSSFSLVHLFGFDSIFSYTYFQSSVYRTISPTAPPRVNEYFRTSSSLIPSDMLRVSDDVLSWEETRVV